MTKPLSDNTVGLIEKYRVERVDGKPVGWSFVLEDKDPLTPIALRAYAAAAYVAGYHQLSSDLHDKANALDAERARLAWVASCGIEDPSKQPCWHCAVCDEEAVGRVCDGCGSPMPAQSK